MDEYKIIKPKEIIIRSNSKKEFFLIHGYTGSSTDFNSLGEYLNKRFNANVRIILLKGHGTNIKDLNNLNYKEFLEQVKKIYQKDLNNNMKIVIIGLSLGSILCLDLASKYKSKGVISISTPIKFTKLSSFLSFIEPIIPKKNWKKLFYKYKKSRRNSFYYDASILSFKILKQGNERIKLMLRKIKSPCFLIHVKGDKFVSEESIFLIKNELNSKIVETTIFSTGRKASHNPFFSKNHKKLYSIIGNFVEKNKLFD